MSLLRSLSRAHELLSLLARRLGKSALLDAPVDEEEFRDTLIVLLRALEKHEKLEELVFRDGEGFPPRPPDALKAALSQHRRLDALRDELQRALSAAPRESAGFRRSAARRLARELLEHFRHEESELWPSWSTGSRSFDRLMEHAAEAQVKELERDMIWTWQSIEDSRRNA